MKKNGLEILYLIFVKYTVHPERVTTSGRRGIKEKFHQGVGYVQPAVVHQDHDNSILHN